MLRRILKLVGIVVGVLAAALAALLLFLTVTEFQPAEVESVSLISGDAFENGTAGGGSAAVETAVDGGSDAVAVEAAADGGSDAADSVIRVVTWNTGYGALGDNTDFFMDGGSMVTTADRARVEENIGSIADELASLEPDVIFLQETDVDSARSYHIDETAFYRDALAQMQSAFAMNFSVRFIPYPVPPIGQVNSGLLTLTKLQAISAERIQLPCPFSWPVRLGNLKRCLLVTRVPLDEAWLNSENSRKSAGEEPESSSKPELVLVNLHLEAYDDGEGKAAQTAMLKTFLEQEAAAGNYVIAGGDFNQSFSSADLAAYEPQEGKWAPGIIDTAEFGEEWQFLMDESVPSCRSLDQIYKGADKDSFQYYLIDGFIVSSNLEVKSLRGIDLDFVNTDHNPVVLEVALRR